MSLLPDVAPGDWLDGCRGFVVVSGARPIGRVVDVERDADSGRPLALVVRWGVAGWRRRLIPVDDVAGVLPSSRRIIVNGSWPPPPDEQAAPSPAH